MVATISLLAACAAPDGQPCTQPDDCPADQVCGPVQRCIADERPAACRLRPCHAPEVATGLPDGWTSHSVRAHLRLADAGNPPATRAGLCWAIDQPPTVDPDVGGSCMTAELDGDGSGTVVVDDLPSGSAIYLQAFADNGLEMAWGDVLATSTVPDAPQWVSASDGDRRTHVEVDWETVRGASAYRVLRDGRAVATLVAPPFVDTQAASPPPPAGVTRLEVSRDLPDRIELSWPVPSSDPAPRHDYAVIAVGATGESDLSTNDVGGRAAIAADIYELSEAGGAWVPVGPDPHAAIATDEPFAITQLRTTVSRDRDPIELLCEGDPVARVRTFRVRAVSPAGAGEPSPSMGGTRGPQALTWRPAELRAGESLLGRDARAFDVLASSPTPSFALDEGRPGIRVFDCSLDDLGREIARSPLAWGYAPQCLTDADCGSAMRCYEHLCAPPATARVLAGRARMGAEVGSIERDSDELLHEIELTSDFFIGTHEVTRGLWESVMGAAPTRFAACGPDCPVVDVTWYSAVVFANRLSEFDGLAPCYALPTDCVGDPAVSAHTCGSLPAVTTPSGSVYDCEGWRLPTEAEWEYAARGPVGLHWESGLFPISDEHYDCIGSVPHQLDDYARFCGNATVSWDGCLPTRNRARDCAGPAPVGSYLPTTWGLYDMYGNAAELIWDAYAPYDGAFEVDPERAPQTIDEEIIRRGGFWYSGLRDARASDRNPTERTSDASHAGLRVVRTAFD